MTDFDRIKERIQKHSLSSILHFCLETLDEVQRRKVKSFPIWNLLALVKWTYLHSAGKIVRPPIKPHEFNQLLELIRDFEGNYDLISFKNGVEVRQSFRIIAYQQFSLQDRFHQSLLSRQLFIYTKLTAGVDIAAKFQSLTGVEVKRFLEYCYFTILLFSFDKLNRNIRYECTFSDSYFVLFTSKWGNIELQKFLTLLTVKSREDLQNLHKLNDERLQLYETAFFTTKPFLFHQGRYKLLHRKVFVQTCKHFIYDFMKRHCPGFSESFGKRLMRYVELGLKENRIAFINDSQMKKAYQLKKVSDAYIPDGILIEVKAMELHPRAGVMRTSEMLAKELDSTIIKAYTQLLSTATSIDPAKSWWGLVITYKEMYIGFGTEAWQEFLRESVERFCAENNIPSSVLPPENLFFISIEDWDHMMQAVKDGSSSLKEILVKAKEVNNSPNIAEQAMLMEQVLHKHFPIESFTLSYLADTHKELDIIPQKEL